MCVGRGWDAKTSEIEKVLTTERLTNHFSGTPREVDILQNRRFRLNISVSDVFPLVIKTTVVSDYKDRIKQSEAINNT